MTGRIEQRHRLRNEAPPGDAVVVVRGGPDTVDKLRKHATRTSRAWALDGEPLSGISVFCALDEIGDASLDGILTAMASYRLVHLCSVQDLNSAGFELLATATRPHFTLCHAEPATTLDVERLLEVLGSPQPNPYHRRPPTGR